MVYVTATVPYILLSILLVRAVQLDGALDGILFYLRPDFERLLSFRVQLNAFYIEYSLALQIIVVILTKTVHLLVTSTIDLDGGCDGRFLLIGARVGRPYNDGVVQSVRQQLSSVCQLCFIMYFCLIFFIKKHSEKRSLKINYY